MAFCPTRKVSNISTYRAFLEDTILTYRAVALKDVVWLNTNEQVNVIARYAPWDGFYMVRRKFENLGFLVTTNKSLVPLP